MSRSKKQGYTRKRFLKTALAGAGGIAAWPILGGCKSGSYIRDKRGPAAQTLPFNTGWHFGEATDGSSAPGFDDSGFEKVMLPHTVTDLSWREWDPESWEKVWIYRRHFDLGEDFAGMRTFLDFGAAMTAATVTLNGHKLGKHIGGYLPFSYEITDHLIPGENVLAVKIDSRFKINVPPNLPKYGSRKVDFWQPGGLYRPVNLRVVPQMFLTDVFAKPVNVLDADRRVEVECTLDAGILPKKTVQVDVELRDNDNTIISTASVPVGVDKIGRTTVKLTLKDIGDIRLWDVDDPQLYDVVATLSVDDNPVHDYATRIGFREARFTKQGFFLNGHRIKIFGLNRHQFYPFAGGAMPARVQRKDAEILRHELNCNMVRCSHYPQSEEFLDACDELGLMAWDEPPGQSWVMGNEQWQEQVVRQVGDMVRRDRNHTSVVIWGVRLNEIDDNVPLWTRTRDLAHSLDDSRPTTGGMRGPLDDTENFVQDVFSLNDYWQDNGHAWLRPPRTDFPYLASEAIGTLSGPAKYYRRDDPAEIQQGQALAHAWVHEASFSDVRYCGLLAWCGFDYPSGKGNRWRGVKYNGVVDLFRVPKPGAAIYRAQIDPDIRPVIAPAFYWDFHPKSLPLKDGKKAMICSNCERLELFVNGEHYAGVEPATERFGHLPYPPSFVSFKNIDISSKPELRIEGYVGAEQVLARRFSADPSGDTLLLTADDKELIADGTDATRILFRAVDKFGAPRPYVSGDIELTLEGPATLVGDNPFAFEEAGGVGAVWARTRPGQPGRIRLEAVHHPLGSASIEIAAV